MSNNNSQSIDEAVARMAALINHLGVEFNSFLKFLSEQGIQLAPPGPPPMLDTAALDRELGISSEKEAFNLNNQGTNAAVVSAAELYTEASRAIKADAAKAAPGSLEAQIERMRDQRPAGVTLGVDCGVVETVVGEVVSSPVNSPELQQLIDATRVRVEAGAKEGWQRAQETMNAYAAGTLDTRLSEMEVGSHTLAAIRGERPPTKKMGEFYREEISDGTKVDELGKLGMTSKDFTMDFYVGTNTAGQEIAGCKTTVDGVVTSESNLVDGKLVVKAGDEITGVKIGNVVDIKIKRHGDVQGAPSPEDEVVRNADGTELKIETTIMDMTGLIPVAIPEDASTKLREINDGPGALLDVELSTATPVSDIAAALMLDNMVANSTVGDSPDYPVEAAAPVTLVNAEEAGAPNKFKYYEQLAFKDVRGMFRNFFNVDVIEGGHGNIGTEKTDKFISVQRYREDLLRIGAPRTAAFPLGLYRDSETGGYQLYLPTDFPRASETKVNLVVTGLESDDYKIFYTEYDELRVPRFTELDPKSVHAETIFLMFMETLRAHQAFNKQFKVL